MTNYNVKNINELFHISKKYAIDNNISNILVFAKKIENVLNLSRLLSDTDIKLIVTTFPSNQILYIENETGEVEEILIECTETRDQPKNKERALSRLRTFIYDREHQKYVDDIASRRKSLVSTGDRSAKIRTYNYPQGRVTDHRIGYTTHDLQGFIGGDIQAMIDALIVAENTEKLKEAEL